MITTAIIPVGADEERFMRDLQRAMKQMSRRDEFQDKRTFGERLLGHQGRFSWNVGLASDVWQAYVQVFAWPPGVFKQAQAQLEERAFVVARTTPGWTARHNHFMIFWISGRRESGV